MIAYTPLGAKNKSCDILARRGDKRYYFESKDSSSEITTRDSNDCFTPLMREDAVKWIKKKAKEADVKGANYLICRLSNWTDKNRFPDEWIKTIFIDAKKISNKNYQISTFNKKLKLLRGLYLIKPYGYVKITFSSCL